MANRFLNNIRINDEYTLPSADGSANQIIQTDGAGQLSFVDNISTASSAEKVSLEVRFEEAVSKGDPVYVSGFHGSNGPVKVSKARSDDSDKMPAFGLADADYSQNATGHAISLGNLDDIDTSSYSIGDTLYVAPTGGLTDTKPTGSNLIQNVGTVSRSNQNNGSIEVTATGRSNDVPNLTTGKIWVGTANNTAESGVVHLDESNSRMGIGTTSPNAKTNIEDGHLLVSQSANTSQENILLQGAGYHIGSTLYGNVSIRSSYNNSSNAGTLNFYIAGGGTSTAEAMRIDSAGNVGIGTTSPQAKLDVGGTARMDTGITEGIHYAGTGLQHWGDGGTGIDFPANDTIDILTSSTSRMRINSSGNVGIGTTSPSTKLQVSGGVLLGSVYTQPSGSSWTTSNSQLILGGAHNAEFNNDNPGVKLLISGYNNDGTTLYPIWAEDENGLVDFWLKNRASQSAKPIAYFGGNVGIGTTTPSVELQVGDGTDDNKIRAYFSDNTYTQIAGYGLDFNRGTSYLRPTVTSSKNLYIGQDSKAWATLYNYATGAFIWGNASSELMRLASSTGYLGIGTTSPSEKLHVVSTRADVFAESTSAGQATRFRLKTTTGEWRIGTDSGVNNDGLWFYDADAASYRMMIDSSGNVGIGTTSPGVKLDVNGSIRFNKQSATNSTSGATEAFIHLSSTGGSAKFKVYKNTNTTDGYAYFRIDRAYDYGSNDQMIQEVVYQRRTTTKNVKFKYEGDVATADDVYLEFYELTDGTVEAWVCHDDFAQNAVSITYFDNTGDTYPTPTAGTPTGTLIHSTNPDTETPNWDSYQGSGYFNDYVGVGTDDPSEKLEVYDGNIKLTDGTRSLLIGEEGGSSYQIDSSGYLVVDATSGIQINKTTTGNVTIASGNVGIGTTSPQSILHITDANPEFILEDTSNSNKSRIKNVDGNLRYEADYDSDLGNSRHIFFIDGSEKLRIDTNGNVGIGTTDPSVDLHVEHSDSTAGLYVFTTDQAVPTVPQVLIGRSAAQYLGFMTDDRTSKIITRQDETSGLCAMNFEIWSDSNDNNFIWQEHAADGTSGSIKMILDNGNLGIGAASPSDKLHIVGSNGSVRIDNSSSTKSFSLTVMDSNNRFRIYDNTSSAERLTITNGGNLGIGTTSPSYKLSVNGAVQTDMVRGYTYPTNSYIDFDDDDLPNGNSVSLTSVAGMAFVIDSNNNATNDAFYWKIDGTTATGSTIMTLADEGSLQLNNYGSGTFTGTATQRLGVDSSGNVIEIPIGSGAVDGSGTANDLAMWSDSDTLTDAPIAISGNNATFAGDVAVNGGDLTITSASTNSVINLNGGNSFIEKDSGTDLYIANNVSDRDIKFRVKDNGSNVIALTLDGSENGNATFSGTLAVQGSGDSYFTGNVGIGVTSPDKKLEVSGDIKISGGDYNGLYFENASGTTKTLLYQHASYDALVIKDIVNNADRVTFKNSGNVGIGTTSPRTKLHLSGLTGDDDPSLGASTAPLFVSNTANSYGLNVGVNNAGDAWLQAQSNTAATAYDILLNPLGGKVGVGTTDPSGHLTVYTSANRFQSLKGTNADLEIVSDNNANPVALIKGTGTADLLNVFDNTTEVFTIKDGGNVGIYNTNPSTKLDVNGTIKTFAGGSWASNAGGTQLTYDGTDTGILSMYYDDQNLILGAGVSQKNGITISGHTADNKITFKAGNSERMVISGSSGNVGINETNPSYKLDVNGSVGVDQYIYHKGDNDTYLRFTTDQIKVIAGNREMIRFQETTQDTVVVNEGGQDIDFRVEGGTDTHALFVEASSDNVGIGTASPDYKLDVDGDVQINETLIAKSGADLILQARSSQVVGINSNGTRTMTLDASNNVGIGTTSPLSKADISTGQEDIDLIIRNSGGGYRAGIMLYGGTTDVSRIWHDDADNGKLHIGYSQYYNVAPTASITTTKDGDVGIGTTSPDYKLDVAGAIGINTYIHHNGDTNTFIGYSANDTFDVNAGGIKQLSVTSDNVHITDTLSYEYPSATNEYNGEIVTFGTFDDANGTIAAGDVIVYTTAGLNSGWMRAQGNTTYSKGMLGIAIGTSASDGILIKGFARNTAFASGGLGSPLYLSPTSAGDTTNVIPSSTNNIVRIVGYMLNPTNDEIFFDPDKSWVQVS